MMNEELLMETISLGPNNIGSLGPNGLEQQKRDEIHEANRSGSYVKPASVRWICIDGRLELADWQETATERDEADPQTAGGIAITETAAEFMMSDTPRPLSAVVATKTREAIADDINVTVHGDDHAAKEGCAANKKMRDILGYAAANLAIVAPLAWGVMERLVRAGILSNDELQIITIDDVSELISRGQKSAENDELWDVTPAAAADIIVREGGSYMELVHEHAEKNSLILIREGAFDKVTFVHEHASDDVVIEQFGTSMGEYAKLTLARGKKHGESTRYSLLKISAAAIYNFSADKALGSKEMQVDLIR